MNPTVFTTSAFFLSLVAVSSARAQSTPGPRPGEPRQHSEIQAKFAAEHAGFREFRTKAGGQWMARFDEDGGNPAMIVGSGIRVSDAPIASVDEARPHANRALADYRSLWGVSLDQLTLVQSEKVGHLYIFTWNQQFDGLDVHQARVQVQMHEAGRICAFSISAVPIPAGFSRDPKLAPEDAESRVRAGKTIGSADRIDVSDFLLFPVRKNGTTTPRLAYTVDVLQYSQHVFERVFVDANNGEILQVSRLAYDFDVKGKVSANVNLGLLPTDAPTPVPVEAAIVTVPSLGTGLTDAAGDYYYSTGLSGPHNVTAKVAGAPYYNILTWQGPSLQKTQATVPSGGYDVADILLNTSLSEFETAQANSAYHHNYIRHHVGSQIPGFVSVVSQPIYVNDFSGVCNAFYYSFDKSLRFFASGGGCVNSAYSTIIYHEYGHSVDDTYGSILSSSLSEGMSDVVAMYATEQPVVGADLFGPNTHVRTGENTKKWPDVLTSCPPYFGEPEPHCVGEPFMGFAWEAWKNLESTLGATAGHELAENLLYNLLPVNAATIPDAVTQVFLLDDDDGDMTNGVPDFTALSQAAVLKGFSPPVFFFFVFPAVINPVGNTPMDLIRCDINNDGVPDLVTANTNDSNVSVLLGTGLGKFAPAVNHPVGGKLTSVASGDLNNDGWVDLASANQSVNSVSILLNTGSGTLAPAVTTTVGNKCAAIQILEMNGDANLDLLVGNYQPGSVMVLPGNGLGGFGAPSTFPCGVDGSHRISVGNLNLDGALDCVVANFHSNDFSRFLGDGSGGFGTQAGIFSASNSTNISMDDFNSDGAGDVVISNNGVRLFMGDGVGGFADPVVYVNPIPDGHALATLDFNGDGKCDVITGGSYITLFTGDGTGALNYSTKFPGVVEARGIVVSDLNGDTLLDIALSSLTSNYVLVELGNGVGSFQTRLSLPMDMIVNSVVASDLNHDGKCDIAANVSSPSNLVVSLGDGTGNFAVPTLYSTTGTNGRLALGDLNGDQNLDAVMVTLGSNLAYRMLGTSAGGFGPPLSFTMGNGAVGLALGDFNTDGNLDMVVNSIFTNNVAYRSGDGLGGFGAVTNIPIGAISNSITAGDLNGDGKLDFACTLTTHVVAVRFGNGLGGFSSTVNISTGAATNPDPIVLGDLNWDFTLDIVTGNVNKSNLSIIKGTGGGGFAPAIFHPAAHNPRGLQIADFNADGFPDIASLNSGLGTVEIFISNGGATFFPGVSLAAGNAPNTLRVADLNADGKQDILTSNGNSKDIVYFLNESQTPPGTALVGSGTPGCQGVLGMRTRSRPKLNTPAFIVECTNAPRNTLGFAFITFSANEVGSDPFGLNLLLNVDPATMITWIDIFSDSSGTGYGQVSIPNDPSLIGAVAYFQSIWAEPANWKCSNATYGLIASKALAITILQ